MNSQLKEIAQLLNIYKSLNIEQSINWEKYNLYSIVHHSTSIEGSLLTEEETQLLLDDNITAKGKPLEHHNMQKDHYSAMLFVLDAAKNKIPLSSELIRKIGGLVMQNTGSIYNTATGSFNSSKGEFRLINVHAGNTRFVDFTKVPKLIDAFCKEVNEIMGKIKTTDEALLTSFDAHFNLVSIHPFADGNGRVSRLAMNYIQHFYNLPLSNVFKEDKADYYKALVDTRKNEDISVFRLFMLKQYGKMLNFEIERVRESKKEHKIKRDSKKGFGMSIIF